MLHSAILHLDQHLSTSSIVSTEDMRKAPENDDTSGVPNQKKEETCRKGGCFECGGYVLVDEHNGYDVCSKCGLVQTRRTINITPEYNAGVDVDTLPPSHKRAKGIPGVPKWLIQSLEPPRETSYMEELHHMNCFVNMPFDELVQCNRILCAWNGGHFASDVKVAACMLHRLLRDQFIEETDVRRRMRTLMQNVDTERVEGGGIRPTWSMSRKPMPVIERVGPAPEFPCPTCGHMEHTRKGARFHCRVGGGGLPRNSYPYPPHAVTCDTSV